MLVTALQLDIIMYCSSPILINASISTIRCTCRSIVIWLSWHRILLEVEGCSLTDAARALSKHVNRSSSGWWGVLSGSGMYVLLGAPFWPIKFFLSIAMTICWFLSSSESNKNRLALEAVNLLLNNCCWMNVHLIQPHGPVFEIRVPEGFGARWSKDGLKVVHFSCVQYHYSRLQYHFSCLLHELCSYTK